MNLPNLLTMSRFVLGVFITLLLLSNNLTGFIFATILFIVAAITDFLDGYLAKKDNLISDFGKIMDPIADKVLMLMIFYSLAVLGIMDWWMVIAIAIREVAVTTSRLQAMSKGQVLAAEKAGKIKTVLQMVSVGAALLFLIFDQSAFAANWFYKVEGAWKSFIHVMLWASVLITISSGVIYFRNKWKSDATTSTK